MTNVKSCALKWKIGKEWSTLFNMTTSKWIRRIRCTNWSPLEDVVETPVSRPPMTLKQIEFFSWVVLLKPRCPMVTKAVVGGLASPMCLWEGLISHVILSVQFKTCVCVHVMSSSIKMSNSTRKCKNWLSVSILIIYFVFKTFNQLAQAYEIRQQFTEIVRKIGIFRKSKTLSK